MAELAIIGVVGLSGYLLSLFTENKDSPERTALDANDKPNGDNMTIDARNEEQRLSDMIVNKSFNPSQTGIIPADFNRSSEFSKLAIVPMDFPDAESVPFMHQNMTPFFGAKLTQNTSDTGGDARLGRLQGGNTNEFHRAKRETKPHFGIRQNRDPRFIEQRETNRYSTILTSIQNGVKPFQEVRVAPGLDIGRTTDGVSGLDSFHYGNVRSFDPNIDELRVKGDQQRIDFEGRTGTAEVVIGKQRGVNWKSVPKNKPETFYQFDYERNPKTAYSAAKVSGDLSEVLWDTNRGIGLDELPVGPMKGVDYHKGAEHDFSVKQHQVRHVRFKEVSVGTKGPMEGIDAKGPMNHDLLSSTIIRNNKTHDHLVENYPVTPVGNQKQPRRTQDVPAGMCKNDNRRINKIGLIRDQNKEMGIYQGQAPTTKNKGCHKGRIAVNEIFNPRLAKAYEVEQFNKNPYSQGVNRSWGDNF